MDCTFRPYTKWLFGSNSNINDSEGSVSVGGLDNNSHDL